MQRHRGASFRSSIKYFKLFPHFHLFLRLQEVEAFVVSYRNDLESEAAGLKAESQKHQAKLVEIIGGIEEKWLKLAASNPELALAAPELGNQPKPDLSLTSFKQDSDSGCDFPTPPELNLRPDLSVPPDSDCAAGFSKVIRRPSDSTTLIPLDGLSKTAGGPDASDDCQVEKCQEVAGVDRSRRRQRHLLDAVGSSGAGLPTSPLTDIGFCLNFLDTSNDFEMFE